jgi:hypothetical protein
VLHERTTTTKLNLDYSTELLEFALTRMLMKSPKCGQPPQNGSSRRTYAFELRNTENQAINEWADQLRHSRLEQQLPLTAGL